MASASRAKGRRGRFVDAQGFDLFRVAAERNAVDRVRPGGGEIPLDDIAEDGLGIPQMGIAVSTPARR